MPVLFAPTALVLVKKALKNTTSKVKKPKDKTPIALACTTVCPQCVEFLSAGTAELLRSFCATVQYAPVRPTSTRLPDLRAQPGFLGETVEVVDFAMVVVVDDA